MTSAPFLCWRVLHLYTGAGLINDLTFMPDRQFRD
jgi:hypothetical protein